MVIDDTFSIGGGLAILNYGSSTTVVNRRSTSVRYGVILFGARDRHLDA